MHFSSHSHRRGSSPKKHRSEINDIILIDPGCLNCDRNCKRNIYFSNEEEKINFLKTHPLYKVENPKRYIDRLEDLDPFSSELLAYLNYNF